MQLAAEVKLTIDSAENIVFFYTFDGTTLFV